MSFRTSGGLSVFWCAVAVPVILLSCTSCTTLKRIPRQDLNAQQLVGSVIRVTTIDGKVLELRLLDVTEDALVGRSQQVRLDNVAFVERRVHDPAKTACLGVGRVAAVVVVTVGLLLAVIASNFNP